MAWDVSPVLMFIILPAFDCPHLFYLLEKFVWHHTSLNFVHTIKSNKALVQDKQAPNSSQQSGQRPDSSEQHSYLYIFVSQFLHGFSRASFSLSLATLSLHSALLQETKGLHLWGGSTSSSLSSALLSLTLSLSVVEDEEWSALTSDERSSLFWLSSEIKPGLALQANGKEHQHEDEDSIETISARFKRNYE